MLVKNSVMMFLHIFIITAIQYFIWNPVNCDDQKNSTNDFVGSNSTELEKLASLMFDEYWQLYLENYPEEATMLGDRRYEDRLDSYSLKFFEKQKVMLNEFLERANQMLPLASEGSKLHSNIQLFTSSLQHNLLSLMSGSYLLSITKLYTPEIALRHLLKYIKLNETDQYWNLLARYRAMSTKIDEHIEVMREGIRTNFTLSNYSLPKQRDYKKEKVEETSFYKPFLNISISCSENEKLEIQQNATDAILSHLIPAFEKFDNFIQNEYRPNVRPGIGVSVLPDGKEYYKQMLSFHLTDNNISAEQIHEMGKKEVARIASEMNEVILLLGLNVSRQEFNEILRQDDTQYFKSEEEAVQTYSNVIENIIKPRLSQFFKSMPKAKLAVESVPKEMATGIGAYYMLPSPDGSTPGTFYIDTSDLKSIAKYDVMTLSLHEGMPGHHFQYAYLMEQDDLPIFRKYGLHNSAYSEGWALYSEYLGYELGLFEDLYNRFGHLNYEIFRACRLVIDTGIHFMGWTRQQAIDYMKEYTAFTTQGVEREVDRYISMPGQACAYKYGELKIKKLRNKAEDELGDDFDVKEFHDVILRNYGPLAFVEKEIDRHISFVKSSKQL